MKVNTKFFGEIEISEESIYTFKKGIPGFRDIHKFVLIDEEDSPFYYLQSIEDQYPCFVMMNPFHIISDYEIDISEGTVAELEIEKPEDVMLYTILTIPEDIKNMTANLQAPIILNMRSKLGAQEILDNDRYSRRHKLVKETDA